MLDLFSTVTTYWWRDTKVEGLQFSWDSCCPNIYVFYGACHPEIIDTLILEEDPALSEGLDHLWIVEKRIKEYIQTRESLTPK